MGADFQMIALAVAAAKQAEVAEVAEWPEDVAATEAAAKWTALQAVEIEEAEVADWKAIWAQLGGQGIA